MTKKELLNQIKNSYNKAPEYYFFIKKLLETLINDNIYYHISDGGYNKDNSKIYCSDILIEINNYRMLIEYHSQYNYIRMSLYFSKNSDNNYKLLSDKKYYNDFSQLKLKLKELKK